MSTFDRTEFLEQAKAIFEAKSIVIIAGSGISESAGIPTFRGPKSSITNDRGHSVPFGPDSFRYSAIHRTNDTLGDYYDLLSYLWRKSNDAQPTLFHIFASQLARNGRLLRFYTQNIDCLERKDDDLSAKTVQLHGSIRRTICDYCRGEQDYDPKYFQRDKEPPICQPCLEYRAVTRNQTGRNFRNVTHKLRPKITLYGQPESDEDHQIMTQFDNDQKSKPDIIIVAGTSMSIDTLREIFKRLASAKNQRNRLRVIWVNPSPPRFGLKEYFTYIFPYSSDSFAESWLLSKECCLLQNQQPKSRFAVFLPDENTPLSKKRTSFEVISWRLKKNVPPAVLFTFRAKVPYLIKDKSNRQCDENGFRPEIWDFETSEQKAFQNKTLADCVLMYWETQGGRDQAILDRYKEDGSKRLLVSVEITRVIGEISDVSIAQTCKIYEVELLGYQKHGQIEEDVLRAMAPKQWQEYKATIK